MKTKNKKIKTSHLVSLIVMVLENLGMKKVVFREDPSQPIKVIKGKVIWDDDSFFITVNTEHGKVILHKKTILSIKNMKGDNDHDQGY